MVLILSADVKRESIGRLVFEIDYKRKDVKLFRSDGLALDPAELELSKKYLRYHHREIIAKEGVMTGWTITTELLVGDSDRRVRPPRAPKPVKTATRR
jgi:hypothetical protein